MSLLSSRARRFASLPDLSLDFRLGVRMLVKYPVITLVGGLAMAFGIWVGAVTFEMITMLVNPSLPLPGGDRVVQLRNWDVIESQSEPRALHDYLVWKGGVRSVTSMGAWRDVSRNLITGPGDAQPVVAAEISAEAFRVAAIPPLLGRTLQDADEAGGAPPVAVIGYDVWQSRFGGDSGVIGRSVQVGGTFTTIVGVMPKDFAFPVSHELWMPLRLEGLDRSPRAGPSISVFGRLADGASLEEAQAELTAIGRRTSLEYPTTHKNLQAQVQPYTAPFMPKASSADSLMFHAIPGFAVLLLTLVCSNVALLMFARAATRENELVVRSALGASRARIIMQMFAEALVLGGLAAAVGLLAADVSLRVWGGPFLTENMGRLPFWYDPHLSTRTMLYGIGLTLLAATIAGVLPAFKVTRGMWSRLRQAGAGGGGLKFGGVWTAVIVTQVAVTTAFPAVAYIMNQQLVRIRTFEAGFPSEQYLSVWMEPETPSEAEIGGDSPAAVAARKAISDRFMPTLETLRARLAADPNVLGVTFVDRLPRDGHREALVETDDRPANADASNLPETSLAYVSDGYFGVLGAPILAGRDFGAADFHPDPRTVIVDQAFVDQVLEGRNAVGQRIRFVDRWILAEGEIDTTQHWREVVGVVKELGMGAPYQRGRASGVYIPTTPGHQGPTYMMLHTRSDPMAMVPLLRTVATDVDPTLRLSQIKSVDQVMSSFLWIVVLWLRITMLLTAVALLLSLAGIYAVMSFTVAKRTREIGIRVALGANARRVVAAIFRRPLIHVSVGVALGVGLAGFIAVMGSSCQDGVCDDGAISPARVVWLLLYGALVFGVCMLACIVPTRRALAVEPVDALRAD